MKALCVFAVAVLLQTAASATSFVTNTNCSPDSQSQPQQRIMAGGHVIFLRSMSQDELCLEASLPGAILANEDRASFADSFGANFGDAPAVRAANERNEIDFLVQHSELASLTGHLGASNLLNFFNANAAELRGDDDSGPAKGATATAEPSSLLLLSLGLLLFVPFLRKHRPWRRAHHLRPA